MSRSAGWGHSKSGRRPGFALTDVELLDKAEQYERSTHTPTQAGFLRVTNIRTAQTRSDAESMSLRQFRAWIRGYGFDYQLVPEIDDRDRPVLVFVVEATRTAPLRWISRNVREILDFDPEELVGRASIDALYGGRDLLAIDPQLRAMFAELRNGRITAGESPPTCLINRDGQEVPVQLQAGYGARNKSWYVQAHVLDTAASNAPDEDLADEPETRTIVINTKPYLIEPPRLVVKRSVKDLVGLGLGHSHTNGRVTTGRVTGTLTHTTVRPAPGEMQRYMHELEQAALAPLEAEEADLLEEATLREDDEHA